MTTLEKKINDNLKLFTNRLILNIRLQIMALTAERLSETIDETNIVGRQKELLADFKNDQARLASDHDKLSFSSYITEKLFIDSYQNFEEFLFLTIKEIYLEYPKFLIKEPKNNTIQIDFTDIFENSDISTTRLNYIENKVKGLIQSNNIVVLLSKFKTIFGLNFSALEQHHNQLFLIAGQRNLLIHNNGIANSIFVKNLKENNVPNPCVIGESIRPLLDLKGQRKSMEEITILITKELVSQEKQLAKYHDSLNVS